MATAVQGQPQALASDEPRFGAVAAMFGGFWRYGRRNPELLIGLGLLAALLLFVLVGHLIVDLEKARPLSTRVLQPPSPGLPFGSDKQGRNLLAVMVVGTPQTIQIGLFAGLLGVS